MGITAAPIGDAAADAGQAGTGRFITPGFKLGFALVTSLFFLWAIANNFNDILIRHFQKALDLNRAEAGLIKFVFRSEEHTSELQSLMRTSYAVFCLKKKKDIQSQSNTVHPQQLINK